MAPGPVFTIPRVSDRDLIGTAVSDSVNVLGFRQPADSTNTPPVVTSPTLSLVRQELGRVKSQYERLESIVGEPGQYLPFTGQTLYSFRRLQPGGNLTPARFNPAATNVLLINTSVDCHAMVTTQNRFYCARAADKELGRSLLDCERQFNCESYDVGHQLTANIDNQVVWQYSLSGKEEFYWYV